LQTFVYNVSVIVFVFRSIKINNEMEQKSRDVNHATNQQSRQSVQHTIYLVSGYKRAGKDTWYEYLNAGRVPKCSIIHHMHAGAQREWEECLNAARLEPGTVARVKFADVLIDQTIQELGLDDIGLKARNLANPNDQQSKVGYTRTNFEHIKDTMFVGGHSIREHMKSIALRNKEKDMNVYARKTCDAIDHHIRQGVRTIVVTDWRFAHEFDYVYETFSSCPNVSIQTVRVTRSGVRIPPASDKTEHNLDRWIYDMEFITLSNANVEIQARSNVLPSIMPKFVPSLAWITTPIEWLGKLAAFQNPYVNYSKSKSKDESTGFH
jgi:hypothetical protein